MQAIVLSVFMMVLGIVGIFGLLFGLAVAHATLGGKGDVGLVFTILWVLYFVAIGVPWIWSIVAGLRALRGVAYRIPIAGRIAERLLARHDQLDQAPHGTRQRSELR